MSNLVQFPGLGLEFNVNRVAFSIGGLDVYWYGILIATGLLLALIFAFRYAVDFGIDSDRLVDVVLIGTICAVICARAYYVIFSPVPYKTLFDMIDIRQGGLAIYGGIIGAAVFGGLACKWRKLPLLATFDLVAMGFLIGQSIGRWGNFVNQEAFGSNTTLPWGMYSQNTQAYLSSWQATLAQQGVIVNPGAPVHPTFLYESLWCAVGFFALWAYMKKRRFNGEIALMYAAWYGAGRFWIEGLRTDSLMLPVVGLRVSQMVALVSVVVALIALVILRRKYKGTPLMVAVPGWEKAQEQLEQAKQQLQNQEMANQLEVEIEHELAASEPHSRFAELEAKLKTFDARAAIQDAVEKHAGMASVEEENKRFEQLEQTEDEI